MNIEHIMLRLTIANRLDALADVNAAIETCSAQNEWVMEVEYALTLAIEELVTNIIKYGYDDESEHWILIQIDDLGTEILLLIEDDGHEFDPIKGPPPAFDLALKDRPIGGLGLHLIKELSKSMEYTRENGSNKVKVLFYKIPPPQPRNKMMSLQIKQTEKRPGFFILSVIGRLDTVTAPQLEQKINYLLENEAKSISFEMSQLDYVSSAGLRAVLGTYKKLKGKGGVCSVINLQPQVKKIFDIANAFPTLEIFASEAEADDYFDRMQKGELDPKL